MISKDQRERFEILYSCALEASRNLRIPIEEAATKAFEFHDDINMNREELYRFFQEECQTDSEANASICDEQGSQSLHFLNESWVLCGATGSGKSTFVNYIAHQDAAREGDGIFSCTLAATAYELLDMKLFIIDPPGLGDTSGISDKEIIKQIMKEVESKLEYSSQIRAIFYLWSPTNSMKCDIKKVIRKLCKSFGNEVLKSLIILINKNSSVWSQKMDESVQQLVQAVNGSEDLQHIPIIQQDLKRECSSDSINSLKEKVIRVKPYNEEYFLKHRKELFYRDYCRRLDEDLKRSQLTAQITWQLLGTNIPKGRQIELADIIEKFFKEIGTEINMARVKKDKTYVDRLNEEMNALERDLNFQNGRLSGVITWISVFIPPVCVVTSVVRLIIIPTLKHALANI